MALEFAKRRVASPVLMDVLALLFTDAEAELRGAGLLHTCKNGPKAGIDEHKGKTKKASTSDV